MPKHFFSIDTKSIQLRERAKTEFSQVPFFYLFLKKGEISLLCSRADTPRKALGIF
jgi:hypothetical protein